MQDTWRSRAHAAAGPAQQQGTCHSRRSLAPAVLTMQRSEGSAGVLPGPHVGGVAVVRVALAQALAALKRLLLAEQLQVERRKVLIC
jgi:hypothetical protein